MWATGMLSFDAARAAASVEFTSPATTQTLGSWSSRTCSTPRSALAVCSPCVPEPTPRKTSGSGSSSSSTKTSDILWS